MYYVYVLKSIKDRNLYIGCTSDLKKRIKHHQTGQVFATKHRLPLELIYSENYDNKYDAYNTERFYKTARGKKILRDKIIICGVV